MGITHDDEPEVAGNGRQHSAFSGDDAVDRNELWLNDVLKVGDFFVEAMVKAVQAHIGFEAESREFREKRFEFGHVVRSDTARDSDADTMWCGI